VVPAEDVPEEDVPKREVSELVEDPGEVTSRSAFGIVSPFADIATTSEGGLVDGPSGWPSEVVR
jgi:hypothetical protein